MTAKIDQLFNLMLEIKKEVTLLQNKVNNEVKPKDDLLKNAQVWISNFTKEYRKNELMEVSLQIFI